jgi:hypothetical protein
VEQHIKRRLPRAATGGAGGEAGRGGEFFAAPGAGDNAGGCHEKASKNFFFEEKKQKTFINLCPVWSARPRQTLTASRFTVLKIRR